MNSIHFTIHDLLSALNLGILFIVAILCYLSDGFAYFTDQPLDKQWGDDWDDAPYSCNAGTPYEHGGQCITKIAFETDMAENKYLPGCDMSVEQINKRCSPWLSADSYSDVPREQWQVWAGVTLSDFIKTIQSRGGVIYVPLPPQPSEVKQ